MSRSPKVPFLQVLYAFLILFVLCFDHPILLNLITLVVFGEE
jgi:hypothetical protein